MRVTASTAYLAAVRRRRATLDFRGRDARFRAQRRARWPPPRGASPPCCSNRPAPKPGRSPRPSRSCSISIVMPCLNEAETLAGLRARGAGGDRRGRGGGRGAGRRQRQHRRLAGAGRAQPARAWSRSPARGYGNALAGGIAAARGRYVLMGDADGSYDFGALPRFLAALACRRRPRHGLPPARRAAGASCRVRCPGSTAGSATRR